MQSLPSSDVEWLSCPLEPSKSIGWELGLLDTFSPWKGLAWEQKDEQQDPGRSGTQGNAPPWPSGNQQKIHLTARFPAQSRKLL